MQESHSGVGVGRKCVGSFAEAMLESFERACEKMLEYQNGPKTKREDGEEEKEFRMLKSDDKSDADYLELVKSMVKSVRLAAHPNTLLLMSSAASYGVGERCGYYGYYCRARARK